MAKKSGNSYCLRPTKSTLGIFVILLVVFLFAFSLFDIRIFPCKVTPIVFPPPPAIDSVCNFGPLNLMVGTNQEYTAAGYFVALVMFILIPYIIATLVSASIRKK